MEQTQAFLATLRCELIPSLGCTEPIAIAYAAASARELLGEHPLKIQVLCSGNVIKNVKSVTVPNSGGLCGIPAAAILGVLGGDPSRNLEVLSGVNNQHRQRTVELMETDYCTCSLLESKSTLDILIRVWGEHHSAAVQIRDHHTNLVHKERDGQVLLHIDAEQETQFSQEPQWNLVSIYEFVNSVDPQLLDPILRCQIQMNEAISGEGLRGSYGARVGASLLKHNVASVDIRARAFAAAGSDARMSGCAMPVVINSGSGNQGLAVCLPVIQYAQELQVGMEKTLRALALSNLVAIYQKKQIGSLSAYCGAVCAAAGSGAAITYLHGGSFEQIGQTIVNTIGCVGGILCDGAKPSCAAKIAICVEAAIMAHRLSMDGLGFSPDEGLVKSTADATIRCIGSVAREGMRETDRQILQKMMKSEVQ